LSRSKSLTRTALSVIVTHQRGGCANEIYCDNSPLACCFVLAQMIFAIVRQTIIVPF
jgi:hypothetical protein